MVFHVAMPDQGEDGVLIVRIGSDPSWVEFRGPRYSQWTDEAETTGSAFYSLHSALEGWHTAPLHHGDTVSILPGHADHEAIRRLVESA